VLVGVIAEIAVAVNMVLGVMVAVCGEVGKVSVNALVEVIVELGVSEPCEVLVAVWVILVGMVCVAVAGVEVSTGIVEGCFVHVGESVLVADGGIKGLIVGLLVAAGEYGAVCVGQFIGTPAGFVVAV